MNFIEAVKKVLNNYANFNGRARRSEYWWYCLFVFICAMVGMLISPILYLIVVLGTLLPSIAVAARRMHDVGKSGWYMLIPIYSLILAITEGQSGSNEYGPDPKGSEIEDDVNAIGNN